MTPRIVDKDARRREIAEAALRVFARQSIHDFKMADIATEAGIGKGTIYEFFRSKDELISQTFKTLLQKYAEEMGDHGGAGRSPSERIKDQVHGLFRFFASDGQWLLATFQLWIGGLIGHGAGPGIEDYAQFFHEYREMFLTIINDGIASGEFREMDPAAAAVTIMAALDGLLIYAAQGWVDLAEPGLPDSICDTILKGLTK